LFYGATLEVSRILIRPAKTTDQHEIVRLWEQLATFHESLDPRFRIERENITNVNFAALFTSGAGRATFVAENTQSGRLVGFIGGRVNENLSVFTVRRFGLITDLFVEEDYRCHGVGKKLFETTRDWFRREGIEVLQLNAAERNSLSLSFWRSMGFEPFLQRLWLDNKE
jgi:GNAT superfamily N-acetyltransferase